MGNESQKLIEIIKKFISHEFDLEEFQSRLDTANFPKEIQDVKQNIINELEEIRFTKLESNQYDFGVKVAQRILHSLKA